MTSGLEGRTALVTGGTGALGRAVVAAFLEDGAVVHVPWIDATEVPLLEAAVGAAARVVLHETDVTSAPAVEDLFRRIRARGDSVNILANVAGGFWYAPLAETAHEEWVRMMELNATSVFLCCRSAVADMRDGRWGRIINVAARPAVTGLGANMTAYAASKAAVLNFTQSLAEEVMSDGITVNAVVPSVIDTEANRRSMPHGDRSTWLRPVEIAAVMSFLASEAGAVVTGSAIRLGVGG